MNNMEEELIWLRAQDTIRTIQIRMDEEDDKRSGSELDKRLEVLKKEKKIEELIKANFDRELEMQCALAGWSVEILEKLSTTFIEKLTNNKQEGI